MVLRMAALVESSTRLPVKRILSLIALIRGDVKKNVPRCILV